METRKISWLVALMVFFTPMVFGVGQGNAQYTLLRGNGPAVFFVIEGRRHWIVNPETLQIMQGAIGVNWDMVQNVSDNDLERYPRGGNINLTDGYLVRGIGRPEVYLMQRGQKHWITSAQVFVGRGYNWNNVQDIPLVIVNNLPNGPDINR
jgi:hypothetical protein